ncbi:MAG: hypothetical protein Q8O25_03095 [Sulfurisoma sp.]|nr:hypothetical protein [Sulfurisoma sp.]
MDSTNETIVSLESNIVNNLVDEKNTNPDCVATFLSRKYKCVVIWLISIISVSEMIYLLLQKTPDSSFENMINLFLNITEKLNKNL